MTKTFDFTKGISDELTYCWYRDNKCFDRFTETADGIVNPFDKEKDPGAFIGLLYGEKLGGRAVFETTCSFTELAAPMLVFCEGTEDVAGHNCFTRRMEIVIWYKGCNVWDVIPPEHEGEKSKATLLAFLETDLARDEEHTIRVETLERKISITIDGKYVFGPGNTLPESFYAGVMACEGPCRFTGFSISKED